MSIQSFHYRYETLNSLNLLTNRCSIGLETLSLSQQHENVTIPDNYLEKYYKHYTKSAHSVSTRYFTRTSYT